MWTLKKKLTDKLIFKLSKGEEKIVAGIKENKYIPLEILYGETTAEMIEVGENELKIAFPARIGNNRYIQEITIKYKRKDSLNVLNWKPLDIRKEIEFKNALLNSCDRSNTQELCVSITKAKYIYLNISGLSHYDVYFSDGKIFYHLTKKVYNEAIVNCSMWLRNTGQYYICLNEPKLFTNISDKNIKNCKSSPLESWYGDFKIDITAYI
jgi:hypothetical protein